MSGFSIPDPAYRLWRLRRMVAVQCALPMAGFAFALGSGMPRDLVWLALAGVMISGYLLLRLPHGWVESGLMSVTFGATIALSPIWFFPEFGPQHAMSVFISAFASWILLVWGVSAFLPGRGRWTRRNEASFWMPFPVDHVQSYMRMQPGESRLNREVGEANIDGWFPVIFHFTEPELSDLTADELEMTVPNVYYGRIVISTETSQITQYVHEVNGCAASCVSRETFTAEAGGTRYTVTEVHDVFDFLTALGFWLNDAQADYVTEGIDDMAGMPDRALRNLPMDTPMTVLAKWITPTAPADEV